MSKINEQLNQMMGQTVMYKQKQHILNDWHIVDGRIHILTDTNAIIINKSEIQNELQKFKISGLPQNNGTSTAIQTNTDFKNLNTVEDVLMDAIQKVQDDPGFVSQAKAINSSVSQLVNVQKVKIEMMKLHRDR